MSRAFEVIVAWTAVLSFLVTTSTPQMRGPAQRPGGYTLKVEVDSVFLNVSVRDRYNRAIPNLAQADFLVWENGVPQQVEQLISGEAPFNSLLLIDNSGSTQPYLDVIKRAAIEFTRCIKADDQVAVAAFNSLLELVQDFTDYRPRLERAIERIESIGGTALYDALLESINDYMRDLKRRSAIVVFTDGVDNQLEGPNSEGSKTPFPRLFRRIQEVEPIIYTIFLNTGGSGRIRRQADPPPRTGFPFPWPRRTPDTGRPAPQGGIYETARQQLRDIAEQTGGRMYPLTSAGQLATVYREIADDLSIQYQIGYNPTDRSHDGKWHEIKVQIRNRPDLVVRTRKGYYARTSGF